MMQDKFCFKPINLRLDRGSSKIAVTENPTPVFYRDKRTIVSILAVQGNCSTGTALST